MAFVTRMTRERLARHADAVARHGWRVTARADAWLPYGFEWHALLLERG
jgi:hypothetical protein